MNARQTLIDLVKNYGKDLGGEAQKCEALLRDLCGEHKREIHGIVCAVREKIPQDLQSAGAEPVAILYARLGRRLHENRGLDETLAKWSVESWAVSFGMPLLPLAARQSSPSNPVAPASPITGRANPGAAPAEREAFLVAEIAKSEQDLRDAEADAQSRMTGGLLGRISAMKVGVTQQTLAMLQERLRRVRLGLPEQFENSPQPVALSGPPEFEAPAPVQGTVEIANVAGKWKDVDSDYPKLSWRFTARSTYPVPVSVYYEIKFLDADGFQQGYANGNLAMSPGIERAATGESTLDHAEAQTVTRLDVDWRAS